MNYNGLQRRTRSANSLGKSSIARRRVSFLRVRSARAHQRSPPHMVRAHQDSSRRTANARQGSSRRTANARQGSFLLPDMSPQAPLGSFAISHRPARFSGRTRPSRTGPQFVGAPPAPRGRGSGVAAQHSSSSQLPAVLSGGKGIAGAGGAGALHPSRSPGLSRASRSGTRAGCCTVTPLLPFVDFLRWGEKKVAGLGLGERGAYLRARRRKKFRYWVQGHKLTYEFQSNDRYVTFGFVGTR